jgi:hypothetical protein
VVEHAACVEVDRTALWILLAASSLVGGVRWVVAERRAPDPARPRAERFTVAALTGVGAGMAVAGVVLLLTAVAERLS